MEKIKNKQIILCIMDGWGINNKTNYNAVAQAKTPNFDHLSKTFPYSTLEASGEHVGLPIGQVGNSEVGHMNLGSGRIALQTLPRINQAFKKNSVKTNKKFNQFIANHNKNKTVHLVGLCSKGGVHSHTDHIIETAKLLDKNKIKTILHIFSDGRDSSPLELGSIITKFEDSLPKKIKIATLIGRYYSMDRDNRWDRIKKSFDLIAYAKHDRKSKDASSAIKLAYDNNETDEFISPTLIGDYSGIQNDDSLLMVNFRSDRVRELLTAFLDPDFKKFEKNLNTPYFSNALGMTEYSEDLSKFMGSIFVKDPIKNTLGEIVSNAKLTQLRLAETEKYPHVTFFFNGGMETPLPGESRIMIPSPKVSTYDLKPEMSARDVEYELINAIESKSYNLIIINFANPDMVGHTGNMKATITAVETVDRAIGNIIKALDKSNGIMLLTADHGNCEVMMHEEFKIPHTAHTCNKVPLILISKDNSLKLQNGKLADVAPTILDLMSLAIPESMNGKTLLVK